MKQVYHPYTNWECFKHGFYNESHKNKTTEELKRKYADFLGDLNIFEMALKKVITSWEKSCEQFLTKPNINKIAWLGQASACLWCGLPSKYRGGFYLLSKEKQDEANKLAWRYYQIWRKKYLSTLRNGNAKDIQLVFPTMYQ